jgi:hypothetical protein
MCFLNENSRRQRLKQGEHLEQALSKAYSTYIDGD